MIYDVTGIDRDEVLRAIYAGAQPLGVGMLHYRPGGLSVEDAMAMIAQFGPDEVPHFDYVMGRLLKTSLRDHLDSRLYDRDNGPGAMGRALAAHGIAVIEVQPTADAG